MARVLVAEASACREERANGLVRFVGRRCVAAGPAVADLLQVGLAELVGRDVAELRRRFRVRRVRPRPERAAPGEAGTLLRLRYARAGGGAAEADVVVQAGAGNDWSLCVAGQPERGAARGVPRPPDLVVGAAPPRGLARRGAEPPGVLEEGGAQGPLERALQDFVASLAHELRNPLAGLRASLDAAALGLAEGCREEPGAGTGVERARRLLCSAQDQAARLAALVDQLLESGRVGAGQPALQPRRVELVELCQHSLDAAACADRQHSYDLIVSARPVCVCCDSPRIAQVLGHLLSNARKFSDGGRPIALEVGQQFGLAVVGVRDRGMGVPRGEETRIFEGFYRGGNVRGADGPPGLGIGLFVARMLVHAHGGDIGVQANPGGGSLFRFTLPLSGVEAE